MSRVFLILFVLLALVASSPAAAVEAKTPTAIGTGGAAASVDVLGTQAAIDVLRAGGNAVDAAVAAAAVLGVVEPYSCGIGGGGFMVIRTADGRVTTIDGRETAPAAMHPQSFWENRAPLSFVAARWSGLSAGVPGTVRSWDEALRKYGTMSLAELLEPATEVARDGFEVDAVFTSQTQANVDFFDDITSTRAVYLEPDGTPYDPGETFRNPDMARAYERIVHLGVKGFYRGAIADAMVEAVQNPPVAADANHVWRPGVMTMRDVLRYVAPERAPTHVDYRGLDVYSMGPPSSGGSTVGEALNILEGWNLGGDRVEALHRYLESSAVAFADRNRYLGDSDFVDVPLAGLLSDSYADERRPLIGDRTGVPYSAGDPTDNEGESTTHLTVSDRWGNVVAYTFTIESTGGNGITVPGWGFLLNNELTDFDFALLNHPNSVAGGKRPRSSMSPTIVLDDGQPRLALGSPGGSMIITTVLQILVSRLDFGMSLPEALAAPRASQRNTATVFAEPAFRTAWESALAARGHSFSTSAEIGAATAIEFGAGGLVTAAAEPVRRGGGHAAVENP